MTAKRRQLLEEIKASGWPIRPVGPGMYVATCPSSTIEHPIPASIPRRWWGRPTYTRLRQLAFNANDRDGVTYVASREGTPWTGTTTRELTLKAAFAYLAGSPPTG